MWDIRGDYIVDNIDDLIKELKELNEDIDNYNDDGSIYDETGYYYVLEVRRRNLIVRVDVILGNGKLLYIEPLY